MISADDLTYFLELARHHRLTLAGRALGVNHTTVARRTTKLEESLGVRLFDRGSNGWVLTEVGERLLVHAESISDSLTSAANIGSQPHASLTGSVRMVTPDGFGAFLLAPALASIRARHPDLTLEIITSGQKSSFTTRKFDVAVVLHEPAQRSVWSRPLLHYTLGLYASRDYVDRNPLIRTVHDLHDHALIFYIDETLASDPMRIMSEILPDHTAKIQISNITGHWKATAAGLGIAPLPSYIGDADDSLVRILPDDIGVERTYWMVVPRGLMRLPRVQAAVDVLQSIARNHRDVHHDDDAPSASPAVGSDQSRSAEISSHGG